MVVSIHQLIERSESNSQAIKLALSELAKIDSEEHSGVVQHHYENNIRDCQKTISFPIYLTTCNTNPDLWKAYPDLLDKIINLQDDDSLKHVMGNKISPLKLRAQNIEKAGGISDEDFIFLKKYFEDFDPKLLKKFKPAFDKLIKKDDFKNLPKNLQHSILELRKSLDLILKINNLLKGQERYDGPLYIMVQDHPALHIDHIGMEYFYELNRTIKDMSATLSDTHNYFMNNQIPEGIMKKHTTFFGHFGGQFGNNIAVLKNDINSVIKLFELEKRFPVNEANELLEKIRGLFDTTSDKPTLKGERNNTPFYEADIPKGSFPDNLRDTMEKTFDLYVRISERYSNIASNITNIIKNFPDNAEELITAKVNKNHFGDDTSLKTLMEGEEGLEGFKLAAEKCTKISDSIYTVLDQGIILQWRKLKDCIDKSHEIENFAEISSRKK